MRRLWVVLAVLTFTQPALAYRVPLPRENWDETARLTLARAMVGEADFHEPDHVAIAFVLARRFRRHQENHEPLSFDRYIALYSASLRGASGRSEWIRSLPWGPIPGPYGERWERVRAVVNAFASGKLKDPCPNALHWGGTMDRPAQGLSPVSCGLTRNIFYSAKSGSMH